MRFRVLDARVTRYQHRKEGLVHLGVIHDDHSQRGSYSIWMPTLLCGQVNTMQGGWGYGDRLCKKCWKAGAPADQINSPTHEGA